MFVCIISSYNLLNFFSGMSVPHRCAFCKRHLDARAPTSTLRAKGSLTINQDSSQKGDSIRTTAGKKAYTRPVSINTAGINTAAINTAGINTAVCYKLKKPHYKSRVGLQAVGYSVYLGHRKKFLPASFVVDQLTLERTEKRLMFFELGQLV